MAQTSSTSTNPTLPNLLTKSKLIFFYFLEHLFTNHGNPSFNYIRDNQNTSLDIRDKDSYDITDSSKKPKIIIMRNPVRNTETSLDNGRTAIHPFQIAPKFLSSNKLEYNHNTLVSGSFTFYCITETATVTEDLAFEVYTALSAYAPVFRQFFHKIDAPEIGATNKINNNNSSRLEYAVPVTINIVMVHEYDISNQIEGEILAYINQNLTVEPLNS